MGDVKISGIAVVKRDGEATITGMVARFEPQSHLVEGRWAVALCAQEFNNYFELAHSQIEPAVGAQRTMTLDHVVKAQDKISRARQTCPQCRRRRSAEHTEKKVPRTQSELAHGDPEYPLVRPRFSP
jgi:hypothetical protein